jgi:hypothetical protein
VGTKPPSRRRSTKGETPDGTAPAAAPGAASPISNLVVVSDLHVGCQLGLMHPLGAMLDNGGNYSPSEFQIKVWSWWREFWDEFVPKATKGEPYGVVVNGDILDGPGVRGATHQWSHNLTDQARAAFQILKPIVDACEGRFYVIRGTEAHVGKSAQEEERLASELGAIPNRQGLFSRYELWKWVGPSLVHLAHHISATGSMQFESTAPHRELVDSFTEAGRWGRRPPDVIIRSHRHRHVETVIPTSRGRAFSTTTPGWQGKTPFVWRGSGRLSEPQFGGVLVRHAHSETFVLPWVQSLEREEPE